MTQAIRTALRERLERTQRRLTAEQQERFEKAMEIARRCSSKPLLDSRTPDEIIGYDNHGLPR
jgi:antitoxin VapB